MLLVFSVVCCFFHVAVRACVMPSCGRRLTFVARCSVTLEHMRTFVQGFEAENMMGVGDALAAFDSWRLSAQGMAEDSISEAGFMEFMLLLNRHASTGNASGDAPAAPPGDVAVLNSGDVEPADGSER
jgi:hypothetical protein